jgi:integral membrane sensor domain MASE1
MIPFTLWFGAWGAIAAYAGCIFGALGDMPLSVNLYWSLADLWQVLIPLIAFKLFHADISLKSKRDFLIFLVFGCLLNSLVGAIWGSTMLSVGGVSGWSDALNTLVTWFTGNLIVTLVITTLLLKYVTRYVVNQGLFVKKYWF